MENKKDNYEIILSIVNRGHSDTIVEASKKAGAKGGTIIYGRGTSSSDRDSFMGISIEPEKEVVMILTQKEKKNEIMTAICENGSLDQDGLGICFSLPVNQVRGLRSSTKSEEK